MLHITNFRKIAVSLAVFAVLVLGSFVTASADPIVPVTAGHLISSGPINTQGTGFGTLLEVLVLHANGSSTTESGGVAWDGTMDVARDEGTAGDVVLNGAVHAQTRLFTELIANGITDASRLGVIYNVNEEGATQINTVLNDVRLRVYDLAGNFVFETLVCGGTNPNCPGDFPAFEQGQGSDGYLFTLDAAAQAAMAGFFADPSNFRLGLFADISDVGDGADNFYVASTNPVPEPASMLLLGTGLLGAAAGIRRHRKAKK